MNTPEPPTIFPCKYDDPKTCGWGRRERENTKLETWVCAYPNCYYGKQEVTLLRYYRCWHIKHDG